MKSKLFGISSKFLVILSLSIFTTVAQTYKDTLWVPVTFYDFHSNKSNPEFEADHKSDLRKGMVDTVLDSELKPKLGPVPYLNYYIKYWYRDWNNAGKGDFTIPSYRKTAGGAYDATLVYEGIKTVNYDTAFKCIVIQDSLPFLHKGNGFYEYLNDNFFPLDTRGFGKEGLNHNFSFTMELHWKFTKQSNLTFRFTGDDDVWCFINGRLRMDLGGIHSAETDSFNLNNIPGLVDGRQYPLDFFYAERHTSGSHIRITSNIISVKPSKIDLSVFPNDTIKAGETLLAISKVTDDTGGVRPDIGDNTTWRFINSGGNSDTTISPHVGDTVRFRPTEAYTSVTLEGTITQGGTVLHDTITLYVLPGAPDRLVIEAVPPPFTGGLLRDDMPLDISRIPSTSASDSVYAIIRDKYGNFVEASQNTNWQISQNPTIIDRVTNGRANIGEGIIYKKGPPGEGEITAQSNIYSGTKFKDAVKVLVDSTTYTAIRIAVSNGATITPISNLTMSTEICSLLIVQGSRSDGFGWEAVAGNWSMSNTLKATNTSATSAPTFRFCPTDTGRGIISANFTNLSASINVIITPGGPAAIRLYPNAAGSPYGSVPESYNVQAGSAFPLYAKIFDSRGVFLSAFDLTNAPISWRINEISGTFTPTGSLSTNIGNQNTFTPQRAPNTLDIIATFTWSGKIFSDTVRVKTVAGPAHHITIQYDTTSIIGWRDQTELTLQNSEINRSLYALLRDAYDNFVGYAENAVWTSRNQSIVGAATSSNPFFGEGIITRVADNSNQTYVIANSTDNRFRDSILVKVSDITYDRLRIFVKRNGPQYIDTIRVRTDSRDSLFVEGRRSDLRGWDLVAASWSLLGQIKLISPPPSWSDRFTVLPDSIGIGKIVVSRPGSISDTVVAIFTPGLPNNMNIYKREGDPRNLLPYATNGKIDTITAGENYPLVAKIFDRKNVWLYEFEDIVTSRAYISWKIEKISGSGGSDTLTTKLGHLTNFTPKQAFTNYKITATFTNSDTTLTSSVLFFVKSGAIDHLVIEGNPTPSPEYLIKDNPLSQIEFRMRDTTQKAYAILRDRFGNFISTSQTTQWISLQTNLISATEGLAALGEGITKRVGETGQTKVVAINRNNSSLFDTVPVNIVEFTYDSLRIVVRNSDPISQLELPSDRDTTLQVQGKRSYDGKWVLISTDWTYNSSQGSSSQPSKPSYTLIPSDTGNSLLIVSLPKTPPDTLNVRIIPGSPAKIGIYAKEGTVPDPTNEPYPGLPTILTATAGTPFPLVAKVFDLHNVFLSIYELSPTKSRQIHWRLVETPGHTGMGSGSLDDTLGHNRMFLPRRAYDTTLIIASLVNDAGRTFSDTVKIAIIPGPVKKLVLEASSNWQSSPNFANPIDTLRIPDSTFFGNVYAVLRDSLGNFVKYAQVTSWDRQDTIISIRSGNRDFGEGVAERRSKAGVTQIWAINELGLKDSCFVNLLGYYYRQLRIITGTNASATQLTMSTNHDTTLSVEGLRSDTLLWEPVDATWKISSNLNIAPPPPDPARTWKFSPINPGSGIITVFLKDALKTIPDTLSVTFTVGEITSIDFYIHTPVRAGEPFVGVVKIYNLDGLIPGTYCFNDSANGKAMYQDSLGSGGKTFTPSVIVDNVKTNVNKRPDSTYKANQCFLNGVDTVTFTLYNAPFSSDSLNRLYVKLGNKVAQTDPFKVLPGPLASIRLEQPNGQPYDTIKTLSYNDNGIVVVSMGYDAYGNKRNEEFSNWTSNGTLLPIDNGTNVKQIYYEPKTSLEAASGYITAVAIHNGTTRIADSLRLKIIGQFTQLEQAITRDIDGDGFLDHIELHYNRPVKIDSLGTLHNLEINVKGKDYTFKADSLLNPGKTDSVWIIALEENPTPGINKADTLFQTGWTLQVQYESDTTSRIASENVVTRDGAAPVIVSVIKVIQELGDRSKDEVRVVFSEQVRRSTDAGVIGQDDDPEVMFTIWNRGQIDSLMLKGISTVKIKNDSTVIFEMTNNNNLEGFNLVNINFIRDYITDQFNNIPVDNNRKVRVIIISKDAQIIALPNPASPDLGLVRYGEFSAKHNKDAYDYVRYQNGGGVVLRYALTLPPIGDNQTKIRCLVRIYDLAGNLVAESKADNVGEDFDRYQSSIPNLDIYWNGSNANKMKVAPGVYRAVLYIQYYDKIPGSLFKDVKKAINVGIRR